MRSIINMVAVVLFFSAAPGVVAADKAMVVSLEVDGPVSTFTEEESYFARSSEKTAKQLNLPALVLGNRNGYVSIQVDGEAIWLDELDVRVEPALGVSDAVACDLLPSQVVQGGTYGTRGAGENPCVPK